MSAILAQMHRDPIGAGALRVQRKRDRIGLDRAAGRGPRIAKTGLTDCGTVVDIDAEMDHETGN